MGCNGGDRECSTSMVVAVDVTLVAAVAVAVVEVMLPKGWCVVTGGGRWWQWFVGWGFSHFKRKSSGYNMVMN